MTSIVSIVARTLRGASVLFNTTSASIVTIHCGTGVCNMFNTVSNALSCFYRGVECLKWIILPCSQYCPEYP